MYHEIILLGVLISLLFTELTGLSAGLILPGYLLLAAGSPRRLFYTLAISLLAVGAARLFSRITILYGRRRFAFLILAAFGIDAVMQMTGILQGGLQAIGIIIPGLLAREMDRQGIIDTLLSVAVTVGLLAALLMLMGYPLLHD